MSFDHSNPDVYLASTNKGIYRSDDGAQTWQRVYSLETSDLAQDPLYAGFWYAGAPGIGVLGSYDSGQTFHPIKGTGGNGILDPVGRVSISVCESAPNYIYALVEGVIGTLNGVYRSDDYGCTWVPMDGNRDDISWGQAFHTCAIAVDPKDPNILLVGMGGFKRTENATASRPNWVRKKQPHHADYTSFTFIPSEWTGSDTRVLITNDGGYCIYDYPTERFYSSGNLLGLNLGQVLTIPQGFVNSRFDSDLLLSGTQDNGVVKIEVGQPDPVKYFWGGDGGQVSIYSANRFDVVASVGGPPFSRYKFDTAGGARGINCGLSPFSIPVVMFDPAYGSPTIFTHDATGFIFYMDIFNSSNCVWDPVNPNDQIPSGLRYIDVGNSFQDVVLYGSGNDGSAYVLETPLHGQLGNLSYEDRTPPLPANMQRTDCAITADRSSSRPD